MQDYLKQFNENVPDWLVNHRKGEKINISDVLQTRMVYYPGAGSDGQPVHTFVQSHAAHLFIYVDYRLSKDNIQQELEQNGFRGYSVFDIIDLAEQDITPHRWTQHVYPTREQIERMEHFAKVKPSGDVKPFAFLCIFERNPDYGEDHGPSRFAIVFVGGDGIATYDAVFCNKNAPAPFALILQDHGFGGNWNCFGRGGMMEEAAKRSGVYPRFILAATTTGSTEIWDGYVKVNAPGVLGGQNRARRELFERI